VSGLRDEIEITFARAGVLDTRRAALREDGEVRIELQIIDEDNALRREWLGRRA